MNKNHDHVVPLVGGPYCGNSMTKEGVDLPNNLPMFFEKEFYIYKLCIESREDFSSVFYEYSGRKQQVTNVIRSKEVEP